MNLPVENFGYPLQLENRHRLKQQLQPFPPMLRETVLDEIPDEMDPRDWMRIENQRSLGSCQGHAQSSVGELCYRVATGEVTQFSPLFAYYATQQVDGLTGRDVGSTISGGVECATKVGFCPLELMPYPDPPRYAWHLPAAAVMAAAQFRLQSHTAIGSYDEAFRFLATGQGGIEIGLAWGNMLSQSTGIIEQFAPGRGGHAVCLLGYSRRKDRNNRHYLWLANSWSETWGNQGWAEVAPAAIGQMLAHNSTTAVGMSDLSVPVVRAVDWRKESVYA